MRCRHCGRRIHRTHWTWNGWMHTGARGIRIAWCEPRWCPELSEFVGPVAEP